MPLSFQTISHGEIPVGFFNIDTDMILINDYFVFASDFCECIKEWTKGEENVESEVEMYVIDNLEKIGNLMGAIAGRVHTGFIGEVYKKFPFPEKREDFKQKPEGYKSRKDIEQIIKKFAERRNIPIAISKTKATISIGDYGFNTEQFHEVISYLWCGGMPKWKDEKRPKYIEEMMKAVITSKHWLFKHDKTE